MPEIVPAQRHTPADEQFARTAHCPTCNAPPGIACHSVRWIGRTKAVAVPKTNQSGVEVAHAHRLKDARRVAEMKEKHG
jgi:hypothetical protein